MTIDEQLDFFKPKLNTASVRPVIICEDGFSVSIQANKYCQCLPKNNKTPEKLSTYTHYELGNPSTVDESILSYRESDDSIVYSYVPKEVVLSLLYKHGGIDVDTTFHTGY